MRCTSARGSNLLFSAKLGSLGAHLTDDLATLRIIRAFDAERLRSLCFPYSLISRRPLLPRTSAEEGARS